MHAIVVADGDRPTRAALDAAWPGWADGAELVVAADGGARLADELGLPIDVWVGDGDSLPPDALRELERRHVPLIRAEVDKDESDAELALLTAVERGATSLTVVGGLGGRRLDHALANIALLAHPLLAGRQAQLLDGATRIRLASAPGPAGESASLDLAGRRGDAVSLLPFGGRVDGVTTSGLRYPLADEPLEVGPARGLSNVREHERAAVSLRAGRLLVVETASATQLAEGTRVVG